MINLLDQLADTTHPEWAAMISRRRQIAPSGGKDDGWNKGADWTRTGGSFYKNLGEEDEEFFKK